MLDILVVDDESEVCDIISRQLSKQEGFHVIDQAGNGKEALEILEKQHCDILLCDICMPIMDGLELTRIIREKELSIQIVIMSGYSDFSYAKQAIQYNVVEYLVKPLVPKSLFALLRKIEQDIAIKDDTAAKALETFLNVLSGTRKNYAEIESEGMRYGLRFDATLYLFGYLRLCDERSEEFSPIGEEQFQTLRQEIKKLDTSTHHAICFHRPSGRCGILFFSYNQLQDQCIQSVIAWTKNLAARGEQQLRKRLWIGFSMPFSSIAQASVAFEEAERLYQTTCTFHFPCQFYLRTKKNDKITSLLRESITNKEKQCILEVSLKQYTELLPSLFQEIEHLSRFNYPWANANCLSFVIQFSECLLDEAGENETLSQFVGEARSLSNYAEIKHALEKALKIFKEEKDLVNAPVASIITETIKNVITKNLGNPNLSVDMTMKDLPYSGNYIRHLFSQTVHMTIKDYIIEERMELAKKLLMENRYSIKMISEQTGYQDQRYFARSFKDFTGRSPSEFINASQ